MMKLCESPRTGVSTFASRTQSEYRSRLAIYPCLERSFEDYGVSNPIVGI